jgi:uncharacterized membrane protein YeaQ/YmgE (transglycosylase-associated protein family)
VRAAAFDYWVIGIGLLVGLVARFVVPGRRPMNVFLALALGAAGAYGGVLVAEHYGFFRHGQSVGYVTALAGAVAVMVVFVALFRRQG